MDELLRFVGMTICVLILNGARLVIWDLLKHGEEDVREARLRGDGIGKMLGLRKGGRAWA